MHISKNIIEEESRVKASSACCVGVSMPIPLRTSPSLVFATIRGRGHFFDFCFTKRRRKHPEVKQLGQGVQLASGKPRPGSQSPEPTPLLSASSVPSLHRAPPRPGVDPGFVGPEAHTFSGGRSSFFKKRKEVINTRFGTGGGGSCG